MVSVTTARTLVSRKAAQRVPVWVAIVRSVVAVIVVVAQVVIVAANVVAQVVPIVAVQ